MKKIILFSCFFSLSSSLLAETSCYPLYEEKAAEIKEKKAHDVNLGSEIVVVNGHVSVFPGITVPAKINNWAEDLLSAIKYGPELYGWSVDNPKRDWLDALNNSIKSDCRLEEDPYRTSLREIMNELMEDGSFCPDSKVLKSTFLSPYKHFKKVMKDAVKSGRFAEQCANKVVNNSDRGAKTVERSMAGAKSTKEKSANKQ